MNGNQFSAALVHQFGDWPGDGMKLTVAEHFKTFSELDLRRLFQWILKNYQPRRPGPPVLAEILSMWREIPAAQRIALPEPGLSDEERWQMADELYAMLQELTTEKRARKANEAQAAPADAI